MFVFRTSPLRILDLVMACILAFVALVVSAVLSDGLQKTCESFNDGHNSVPYVNVAIINS